MKDKSEITHKLLFVVGLLVFLFAFGVIQYFIWSDLFIAEFDADNAETVLWAEASLMSHAPLSGDFVYTQLIPVGGNLWMLPFVKMLGTSMPAMRLGSCLYACIFCGLLVLLLNRLGFSRGEAFLTAGILLLFTVSQEALRDIFWAHFVYYNLSVLFMMVIFCGAAHWFHTSKLSIRSMFLLLVGVLLGSINGYGIFVYTAFPFFLAMAALAFLNEDKNGRRKDLICAGLVLLTMLLGLLLNHRLTSGLMETDYINAHLVIQSAENWIQNLLKFPSAWIGLFTALPEQNIPFFSPVGIKMVLRILTSLSSIVIALPALLNFRKTESRLVKAFSLYLGLAFCLILFIYIFGNISEHAHRLYPVFFNLLILDAIAVRNILRRMDWKFPYLMKILGIGLVTCWGCTALLSGVSVLRQSTDLSHLNGPDTIYTRLKELGIKTGYTTFYWSGNNITVLTDGVIQSREIGIQDGKFVYPYYQHNRRWYELNDNSGPIFLVCKEAEYYENPWLEKDAVKIIRASDYSEYEDTWRGFFILVFDHDIVAEGLAQKRQNSPAQ